MIIRLGMVCDGHNVSLQLRAMEMYCEEVKKKKTEILQNSTEVYNSTL